ncbi:hypothetical protein POUND7_003335 [Theobroma cacao]
MHTDIEEYTSNFGLYTNMKALDHLPPLAGRLATIEHDNDPLPFPLTALMLGLSLSMQQLMMSSWLETARGSSCLSKQPIFQRWFLNATDCPIRIPHSYINHIDKNEFSPSVPVKVRVFHFTKEVIAILKEKANAEVGTHEISSLQALLSHFWQSVVRNKKNIDPDEATNYCLLIGARQRLQELSEGYFGNALEVGIVTMKAKELLDHGLGNAAWEMNKVVASCNMKKLSNFLESWTKCPKIKKMSNMVRNAIGTSDSPRFDIYGGDTGLGRPVAIRSGPANKFDGRITEHCGVEEGSIDIEVCLSLETFQAMEKDKEFVDTVSIKSNWSSKTFKG